jgi:FtsZ-interacting cell division protein ZipA
VSTGTIIAIVIGAIVLVALLTVAVIAVRRARLANRRHQAGELHRQARGRTIQVEAAQASADRRAAHARRAEAEAEEKAAQARHDKALAQQETVAVEQKAEFARDHYDRARAVDPDSSDTGEEEARRLNDESAESAIEPARVEPAGREA